MIGLDPQVEPIVPMGLITEVLGCEVTWKGKEVKVRHPRRGELKVTHVNGCPQIPRQEALELIRELEDLRSGIGSTVSEFQVDEEAGRRTPASFQAAELVEEGIGS